MSLEGFRPIPNDRLGSLILRVAPEMVPFPNAVVARNIRYKARGVQTRNGLAQTCTIPAKYAVTGGVVLQLPNSSLQLPLFFGSQTFAQFVIDPTGTDAVGYQESPCGSGLTTLFYNANTAFDTFFDTTVGYGRAFFCGVTRPTADVSGVETKFYTIPNQWDGTTGGSLTMEPQIFPATYATSASAGNVDAGVRYAVVLFQDVFGTIHGVSEVAIASYTAADGVHKVDVSAIPTSGTGGVAIAKRIIAFTVAGASQQGPFFYIPEDLSIDTLSITKTVIDNDTATTATFNFTDEVLQGSSSISSPIDFFDKINLPQQGAVYFSPSTRRLIWCNGLDDATIFRLSEADDPGTYLGSTGFIKPSENDGEHAICAREFRGQLYLFKETAGFVAYNDAADPSDWTVEKRWDKIGPVGPWAVDTSEQFMVCLDHSGVYLVEGAIPDCISDEISGVDSPIWSRINWSFKEKFWVYIDTVNDEIHCGVALDQSRDVNAILKCNYLMGLGTGARKWSIDYIPTARMIEVQRTLPSLPASPTPIDSRIKNNQILHLSSMHDGMINLVDPASYTDNGNAIDSEYQTGYYEEPGEMQIGGIGIDVKGEGAVLIKIFRDQTVAKILSRQLPAEQALMAEVIKTTGVNPWFALAFSNNNQIGSWFDVSHADLYIRTMYKTRRRRAI